MNRVGKGLGAGFLVYFGIYCAMCEVYPHVAFIMAMVFGGGALLFCLALIVAEAMGGDESIMM